MNFIDLPMPLNYQWMPGEVLPTSVKFFFGPKDHQDLRSTTVAAIPKGNQEEIGRMDVEWCSMLPTPAVESGEARMYLHL